MVLITAHSSSRLQKMTEKTYAFPDGNITTVCAKHFHCDEVHSARFDMYRSQRSPRHFFLKCDTDIRKNLFANVVLSTSMTMFR